MRKIKFRAWIKTGNETDDYVKPMTIQQMINSKESTFSLEQLNDLVDFEQFTGLKDKNGKEIYEGDILKYTSEDGAFFYAEVKYFADGDNYPAFDFIPPDEDWRFQSNCLSEGTFNNTLEVVGNIHENADVLEALKNGEI